MSPDEVLKTIVDLGECNKQQLLSSLDVSSNELDNIIDQLHDAGLIKAYMLKNTRSSTPRYADIIKIRATLDGTERVTKPRAPQVTVDSGIHFGNIINSKVGHIGHRTYHTQLTKEQADSRFNKALEELISFLEKQPDLPQKDKKSIIDKLKDLGKEVLTKGASNLLLEAVHHVFRYLGK